MNTTTATAHTTTAAFYAKRLDSRTKAQEGYEALAVLATERGLEYEAQRLSRHAAELADDVADLMTEITFAGFSPADIEAAS